MSFNDIYTAHALASSDEFILLPVKIAQFLGIERALILQKIRSICSENKQFRENVYFIDGYWWANIGIDNLYRSMPFFPRDEIQYHVNDLFHQKYIKAITTEGGIELLARVDAEVLGKDLSEFLKQFN